MGIKPGSGRSSGVVAFAEKFNMKNITVGTEGNLHKKNSFCGK